MSREREIEARREDWIDALLDGSYTQGHKALKIIDPGTEKADHCCMGVACDLIDPNLWAPHGDAYPYWDGNHPSSYPPAMRMDFGLCYSDCDNLAAMNDEGADFGDIATHIYSLPIRSAADSRAGM